jgi:hypothetical protein
MRKRTPTCAKRWPSRYGSVALNQPTPPVNSARQGGAVASWNCSVGLALFPIADETRVVHPNHVRSQISMRIQTRKAPISMLDGWPQTKPGSVSNNVWCSSLPFALRRKNSHRFSPGVRQDVAQIGQHRSWLLTRPSHPARSSQWKLSGDSGLRPAMRLVDEMPKVFRTDDEQSNQSP